MTISTTMFYDRARATMGGLTGQVDALTTQISTGKKLQLPSDDAVAYSRLRGMATETADATTYGKNLEVAGSILSTADTTLGSITDQIDRVNVLAVQASTGTLGDGNRATISLELKGIAEQLAALGNTRDVLGQPLFGGSDGGAAVTKQADGTYKLATGSVSPIPVGIGQSVQASDTATRVFAFKGTDIFKVIAALTTALDAGGDIGNAGKTAITDVQAASSQVSLVQSSIGARAQRVELMQTSQTQANTEREALRSKIEDTDVTAAITDLQKTMTILQATQASFTKLQSLSLFDYLK